MKIARAIAWLGVAAMSAALFFGFTKGDFFCRRQHYIKQSMGNSLHGGPVRRIYDFLHVGFLQREK